MTSYAIVVVGLNHRTAPVSLLEQLAIPEGDFDKALDHLMNYEHVLEGAILSTCNRIEAYAAVSKFHGGALDLRNFLSELRHVAPEEFAHHLYTYHDDNAVRHLLRVAAGIDSMIVGESEILGQVRRAFAKATEAGAAGRGLSRAFTTALRVGKRARTETAIGRNPTSISSAAVEHARKASPTAALTGRQVVVVGTGKMGALAAQALRRAGVGRVTLVNRTREKADALAQTMGAEVVAWEGLGAALAGADVVITSTTSAATVIDGPMLRDAVAGRAPDDPLVVVDIAVPRDVDPDAGAIAGVLLYDIDDLRELAGAGEESRRAEIEHVERIVAEEVEGYLRWLRSTDASPTTAALAQRAATIAGGELERIAAILARLDPAQRRAVESAVERAVSRAIHQPLERLREVAGSPRGHLYLEAVRELFGLDAGDASAGED